MADIFKRIREDQIINYFKGQFCKGEISLKKFQEKIFDYAVENYDYKTLMKFLSMYDLQVYYENPRKKIQKAARWDS